MLGKQHALRRNISALITALVLLPIIAIAATAYDWPQFDFNSEHSGNNTLETTLTPQNVNRLKRLFQVMLPSVADGAPAYLSGVATSGGTEDIIFVTTRDGHIIALDAHTGRTVWSHQNPVGPCTINNGGTPCYTTSSPAIDPNRQYVYSYGLDGFVHKYQVGDGMEITGSGWPEVATLKPFDEKGSAALSVATASDSTSYLYVANGGYPGDNGDYQGHLTAINLATGSQHVFNTLCSDQTVHFKEQPQSPDCSQVQSAVWARVGSVYDPDTDRIYIATGNGLYDPANHHWGDSVLALHPDGTGAATGDPLDSYTPTDFQQLQDADADLGSTAPAVLPVPATSGVRHLAVQSGKDQLLRLINLDNLSGQGGAGHTGGEVGQVIGVPQGGEVLTQPAVWVNPADHSTWVYVANDNGLSGLELVVDSNHVPNLEVKWQSANGGSSPVIANNVLYHAGSNLIEAVDPASGKQLWSESGIGGIHWESPIVANGILYITDESSNLYAYSINNSSPTPTPTPTPAQYTISGQITSGGSGLSGISVMLSGSQAGSTTTDAGGNYSFSNLPAGGIYIITPGKMSYAFTPASQTFTYLSANQTSNFIASPLPSTLQFSATSYTAGLNDKDIQITVTRSDNTSGPASVDYTVMDGTATQKSDYIAAQGTVSFAPGDTSRTFTVLLIHNGLRKGTVTATMTLQNAVGATLGMPSSATLEITQNSVASATNPIDDSAFFVRQHYLDFLNREPDAPGYNFWTSNITHCGSDQVCVAEQRDNTSAAFFLSIEFQQTGYLVHRFYRAAYGRPPTFAQFLPDRQAISQSVIVAPTDENDWMETLETNKQSYAMQFVQRPEFVGLYGSMNNAQYVDALIRNTGVSFSGSDQDSLVNGLDAGTETRATVLRKVAENQALHQSEFNAAFVEMQYFGYLRRDPDAAGFQFWLAKLNRFNGDYNAAQMVLAFLASREYRQRFGQP